MAQFYTAIDILGFRFVFPVFSLRLVFADFVGGELEHRFGPAVSELFCAFDPTVNSLDGLFHQGRGNG